MNKMRFVFWTDCISSTYEQITEMREQMEDSSIEEMRENCEEFEEKVRELGYDEDFTIDNDWHVSYYKSFYDGCPCYFFVWSGIEYIWVDVDCMQSGVKENPQVESAYTPIVLDTTYTPFPYKKPDPKITVVVPDPSWYTSALDMWGIGFSDTPVDVLSNPQRIEYAKYRKESAIRWAAATLKRYGFALSHNEKAVICISQHQRGTCRPTAACRNYCYGYGVNFTGDAHQRIYKGNRRAFLNLEWASDSILSDIAEAIVVICKQFGCNHIRWNGIGDLTHGQTLIIEKIVENPAFIVWGFTKKPEVLLELPVQDNLVFWLSVDPSTKQEDLEAAILAADVHGTGLAYASYFGTRYSNQKALRGQKIVASKQPRIQKDRFLADLIDGGYYVSVAFGFHGKAVLTRLNVPMECPATDPLGGGHFFGACHQCGWCRQKPENREFSTLKQHRQNTIVARYPDGTLISLDTGKEV